MQGWGMLASRTNRGSINREKSANFADAWRVKASRIEKLHERGAASRRVISDIKRAITQTRGPDRWKVKM